MSRRTFLHTLGAVSGSLMLAGLPQVQAQSASSTTFQLKAPEPMPKYGGTSRYGILSPGTLRRASVGHGLQYGGAGPDVRQPDSTPSARLPDDHS